jgi:undecaprenyl diphosphate synthase
MRWKNSFLLHQKMNKLNHLGLLIDGHRRWAKEQHVTLEEGYKKAFFHFSIAIDVCLEHKVPYLSLYIFTRKNCDRSKEEVDEYMRSFCQVIPKLIFNARNKNIKIQVIGNQSLFPQQVKEPIELLEKETTLKSPKLLLSLLFCYGGRDEIYHAARILCQKIEQKEISLKDISPELFQEQLWTKDLPPIDLMIRTGKQKRLSDCGSWNSAYSELDFILAYWPDVTKEMLQQCIENFYNVERRFGI